MKKIVFITIMIVSFNHNFAQVSNVRAGLWSDHTVWNNNSLPTGNDSVLLNFDITVDSNGICKYLHSNGHHITINPGINLSITGGANPGIPLLKKFVLVDSTQPAQNDTLYIYTYSYDNLGRCIQIEVKDYENASIGYTYNFFNGNDTLISSRKLVNQVYSDSVFEYFSYSPAGKMLSDSVVEFSGSDPNVFTYHYSSVNDSLTSVINVNGQPFLLGKYLLTKDNYGNIISEKDTSFEYYSGAYHYKNTTTISYTYDSNPCPFKNLYPKRLTGLDYELIAVDDIPLFLFLQNNNTKSKVSATQPTTSGIGSSNRSFTYTYDPNNYPLSLIYRDLRRGYVYKGTYYY